MTNFGLIGVGGIGAYHRAAIEKLEARGAARLIAVADPTVARLPKEKAELEARGVKWHLDYRDMLQEHPELDAVSIATPIPFHYEMALACIKRGVYVNLEKPPVPLLSQLETLIALDVGRRVRVGFQMIGSHGIQTLKQLLVDRQLGELLEIRAGACWPRLDGYYSRAEWAGRMTLGEQAIFDGPATNALAHLIHSIMYLAADGLQDCAVPVEIEAELYRARPIESYDTACLRGGFRSGVQFSLALTHATKISIPFRLEVRGTEGWARLSNDGATLETSDGISCERPETTQQLIDSCYNNLIDIINGHERSFPSPLSSTQGYVATTNAMLHSSGGIHDIDPGSITRYATPDQGGYHVTDLAEAIEENLKSGRLFSEQGQAWATARPEPVTLHGFPGLAQTDLQTVIPLCKDTSRASMANA